jgi:hypothetical protein
VSEEAPPTGSAGSKRQIAQALCLVLASGCGAWAGYVDLHNDDVQSSVLIALASTFLLGILFPREAWSAAMIVGASIPIAHLYAAATAMPLPYELSLPWTLLAFIPSFMGAAAGMLVRRVLGMFA